MSKKDRNDSDFFWRWLLENMQAEWAQSGMTWHDTDISLAAWKAFQHFFSEKRHISIPTVVSHLAKVVGLCTNDPKDL